MQKKSKVNNVSRGKQKRTEPQLSSLQQPVPEVQRSTAPVCNQPMGRGTVLRATTRASSRIAATLNSQGESNSENIQENNLPIQRNQTTTHENEERNLQLL